MKIIQKLTSQIKNHIYDYPTPMNINYFYNFGSLSGICLINAALIGYSSFSNK